MAPGSTYTISTTSQVGSKLKYKLLKNLRTTLQSLNMFEQEKMRYLIFSWFEFRRLPTKSLFLTSHRYFLHTKDLFTGEIKFRIKYTRDDGQEGEMTRWYPLEQPPSLVSWRLYQENVWFKLKEEFGDTVAVQRNFQMYRIEISRDPGSDGDIYVDEVYLGQESIFW